MTASPAGGRRLAALAAAPVLAWLVYHALPASYPGPEGGPVAFAPAGRATAAVASWMALWWLTEAVHVSVTALLPLALFPLLGAATFREAAAPYAHPLIFLFLGGFILALAMERWGLHRRIAMHLLARAGTRPPALIGGFMLATAALSMWLSNTATAVMMLPVATSVIALAPPARRGRLGTGLLLGVAYAASIGGIGTIIGTPPNGIVVEYLNGPLGLDVSFADWMLVGVPVAAAMLPAAWWLLTRVTHPVSWAPLPGVSAVIRRELGRLGPMGRGEAAVLAVFLLAAFAWITRTWLLNPLTVGGVRPLAGLTDHGIAVIAAVLLFMIPVDRRRGTFAMDWAETARLPWGTLLLFGGGLSLASAVRGNGVGEYLGSLVRGFAGMPGWVVVTFVVALLIFLTELTSNTATTATLVPVLGGIAAGLGLGPVQLVVPAAIAASCAFMMPVATPPNAIVFGTGRIRIGEMARAGFLLNLAGIVIVTALTYAVVLPVLGRG